MTGSSTFASTPSPTPLLTPRQLLARARAEMLSQWRADRVPLPAGEALVSFTFDDFPRTAYLTAGRILREYGVRGTYYAALGLEGHVHEQLGPSFHASDVAGLVTDGHEIGSHTLHHVSSRSVPLADFCRDVVAGRDQLQQLVSKITTSMAVTSFAYPYGEVSFRAKPEVGGKLVGSCRSIVPGVMRASADVRLLRANQIFGAGEEFPMIERLLATIERRGGWVIFYTHDVRDHPSLYGCTPEYFERVVRRVVSGPSRVLPVGEVVRLARQSAASRASDRPTPEA